MLNFGGNPLVLQLLQNPLTQIDKLLELDAFVGQFRSCNPKLDKYMDISKYNTLVEYVVEEGPAQDRNRSYKFPMAAAQILTIQNQNTIDALLKEGKIMVEKVQKQEKWVEKEVDECDSEYYSSEGSKSNIQDFFQSPERDNISPDQDNQQSNKMTKSSHSQRQKSIEMVTAGTDQSRKSLGSSTISVTSDDFPFVEEQTKKVKVRQIITRKVQVQVKPLLQQLCEYYQKQINHILTGYVTKILQFLLKKNPRRILREIFTTKIHKAILHHVDSMSVCDFIVNLLLNDTSQAENARQFFISYVLKILVSNSHQNGNEFYNKSLVIIIMDIINKIDPDSGKWHKILMSHIFKDNSLVIISKQMLNPKACNKNKQSYCQLFLCCLKKLLNPIIINAPNVASSATKTVEDKDTKELRLKFLNEIQNCFKGFVDRLFQISGQTQDDELPSYVYLKYFQILNIIVKNNLYWSRIQLSNQDNIFDSLFNILKRFKNNNFVHNQIFELLKQVIHIAPENPSLFTKVMDCKSFIVFLVQTIVGVNPPVPMCKGQCILQVRQLWSFGINMSINGVKFRKVSQIKCGFSMKRNVKTEIMFSKQQVLERYALFLKNELPIKKQNSQQNSQLEEVTSQGSAQWSDWNEFSNYSDQIDQNDNF